MKSISLKRNLLLPLFKGLGLLLFLTVNSIQAQDTIARISLPTGTDTTFCYDTELNAGNYFFVDHSTLNGTVYLKTGPCYTGVQFAPRILTGFTGDSLLLTKATPTLTSSGVKSYLHSINIDYVSRRECARIYKGTATTGTVYITK